MHEVAQAITPAARIVYVDNDPVVMVHARALLTSHPAGALAYVEADLRDPLSIPTDPALRATLDLSRPVGLLLIAVLHFLPDIEQPYEQLAHLLQALPSGSYLALSHATFDPMPTDTAARLTALSQPEAGHGPFRARNRDEVARFQPRLELVEPGLGPIVDWRPDYEPKPEASASDTAMYGAVARLP